MGKLGSLQTEARGYRGEVKEFRSELETLSRRSRDFGSSLPDVRR